jgi:hypothetical protein
MRHCQRLMISLTRHFIARMLPRFIHAMMRR